MTQSIDDKRKRHIKIAERYHRAYALSLTAQHFLESHRGEDDLLDSLRMAIPDWLMDETLWPDRRAMIMCVEHRYWRRLNHALAQRLATLKPQSPSALQQWETMCEGIAEVLAEHDDVFDRSEVLQSWACIDETLEIKPR